MLYVKPRLPFSFPKQRSRRPPASPAAGLAQEPRPPPVQRQAAGRGRAGPGRPRGSASHRRPLPAGGTAANGREAKALRPAEGGQRPSPHLLQGPHVVLAEEAADSLVQTAGSAAEAVLLLGAPAPRCPSAGSRRAAQQQGEEEQQRRQPPRRRHGRPRCARRRCGAT